MQMLNKTCSVAAGIFSVSEPSVLQMRVARLEQLEKELQEVRGSQESQLQVSSLRHDTSLIKNTSRAAEPLYRRPLHQSHSST